MSSPRARSGVLLVRADAGVAIGAGHVMRCLALAEAWRAEGGTVVFAMASGADVLAKQLASVRVERVVRARDPKRLVALSNELDADVVVLDGYVFDAAYLAAVREGVRARTLVIDDMANRGALSADYVLNQNIDAQADRYDAPGARLLLGPRYALLRPEFAELAALRAPIAARPTKILVTLGGSDPDNVTRTIVRALARLDRWDVEVTIVLGAMNPHEAAIRAEASPSMRVERNVTDLAERMLAADLAIAASGSTVWELLCLGVPSMLVPLADNQRGIADGLSAIGAAETLGWHAELDAERAARRIDELLANATKRRALSTAGSALVDGLGAARVVAHLGAAAVALRPATLDDTQLLFRWANDPAARAVSFSTAPIPLADHVRWLRARLEDSRTSLFIASARGIPMGQVRFDVDGDVAVVSVSLDAELRGAGYGARVLRAAAARLRSERGPLVICAYVKPDNEASVRAFERAGYRRVGLARVGDQGAIELRDEPGTP